MLRAAGSKQGLRFTSIVTVAGELGPSGFAYCFFPSSYEEFERIILMFPVRRRSPEGGGALRALAASAWSILASRPRKILSDFGAVFWVGICSVGTRH